MNYKALTLQPKTSSNQGIKNLTVEINGNWGLLRTERNLTKDVLLFLDSMGNKMTGWILQIKFR